jgi:hypothetical protein
MRLGSDCHLDPGRPDQAECASCRHSYCSAAGQPGLRFGQPGPQRNCNSFCDSRHSQHSPERKYQLVVCCLPINSRHLLLTGPAAAACTAATAASASADLCGRSSRCIKNTSQQLIKHLTTAAAVNICISSLLRSHHTFLTNSQLCMHHPANSQIFILLCSR